MGPWHPRWRGCHSQPRSWHWHVRRCGGTRSQRACDARWARSSARAEGPLTGRLLWAQCRHTRTGPPGCGRSSTVQVRRTLGWAKWSLMARAFLLLFPRWPPSGWGRPHTVVQSSALAEPLTGRNRAEVCTDRAGVCTVGWSGDDLAARPGLRRSASGARSAARGAEMDVRRAGRPERLGQKDSHRDRARSHDRHPQDVARPRSRSQHSARRTLRCPLSRARTPSADERLTGCLNLRTNHPISGPRVNV